MIEHVVEGCQCEGKWCNGCEATLCLGTFRARKKGKSSRCLECERKSAREYAQNHAEERRDYSRQYHHSHREQCLADMRRRYKENIEYHREYARNASRIKRRTQRSKLREAQKRSYIRRRTHYLDYQKVYRTEKREKVEAYKRAYYARENVKQHIRVRSRQYAQVNRKRFAERIRMHSITRRARKKNAEGVYTPAEWIALKAQCNYTCLCCGRREPEIKLTVDHVIPIVRGGRNSIDNIQPLCLSCNSRKQAKIIDYRR